MTSYIYNMVDTWNDGATTFTAVKMNVTDTASNASSLLMDLQVGAASKFSVSKSGKLTAQTMGLNNFSFGTTGSSLFFGANPSSSIGWFLTDAGSGIYQTMLTNRGTANLRFGAADSGANTATVTITIATPGVVTWSVHGLSTGTPVVFTTTGALPTGIISGTTYYAVVVDTNTFQIASSVANAIAATPTVITTSGTQSGTHTGTRYNITQRLSMQSVTGVTDRLGADLFIQGSLGTGTGAGGSIIFQVAPAGGTGTAQNALSTAFQVNGNGGITGQDGATANTLALRNSTTAQAFNIYQTYTDSSNYSRLTIRADNGGGQSQIWCNALGSGSQTSLAILAPSITFSSGTGTARWSVNSSGHFVAGTDNTYDIGAASATRPRNLYVASQSTLTGMVQTENQFRSLGSSSGMFVGYKDTTPSFAMSIGMSRPGDSIGDDLVVATFNGTTWTTGLVVQAARPLSLSFGGTSASFPALKRSSTTLQARLADDSAFASVQGKLTTDTAYTAGAIVATGYLTLYDSTGTAYRVPCVV